MSFTKILSLVVDIMTTNINKAQKEDVEKLNSETRKSNPKANRQQYNSGTAKEELFSSQQNTCTLLIWKADI